MSEDDVSEEQLRRMIGMNSPLETLSAPEFDALKHRIRALGPETRTQVEDILIRELIDKTDRGKLICRTGSSDLGNKRGSASTQGINQKLIKTLALVFIVIHSFAVAIVVMHVFHR